MMNLTFSFCLEDQCDGENSFSMPVFKNAQLSKKSCNWTDSYRVKGAKTDGSHVKMYLIWKKYVYEVLLFGIEKIRTNKK